MLGLMLDAGALMLIVMVVNENDQVEFIRAILVALAISVLCGLVGTALASLGTLAFFIGMTPLAAVAGLVIWLTLGMTLERSLIAGALFLVYKIALAGIFMWLF